MRLDTLRQLLVGVCHVEFAVAAITASKAEFVSGPIASTYGIVGIWPAKTNLWLNRTILRSHAPYCRHRRGSNDFLRHGTGTLMQQREPLRCLVSLSTALVHVSK